MYSRSYTEEASGILIPESYGGTALREEVISDALRSQANESERGTQAEVTPETPEGESITASAKVRESPSVLSSLFDKLPFGNILGGLFGNGKLGLQKFGTEEILIIATAAFLLFSKDGDKECAIMLLLLLFIT